MIRLEIRLALERTIRQKFGDIEVPDFSVEAPENPEHGDYATNAALVLAKVLKSSPMDVAEAIVNQLPVTSYRAAVAPPGFINFWISEEALWKELAKILIEKNHYGGSTIGKNKKARVEYVSANPTGPLHIGNVRGGPLGETICRVLERVGYKVLREYIHNDIGAQVEKFGQTLWYWYLKELKKHVQFPDGGYKGDYLYEIARLAVKKLGKSLMEKDAGKLTKFGVDAVFKENKETLKRMGIGFDLVVKESELISSGKTAHAVEEIVKAGVAKKYEGALWFVPRDDFLKDREAVMVRSNGQPTYFASDIAYHKEKFTSGHDLVIDVLGSGHHGHVPKLQAVANFYEFDPRNFIIILYQNVSLKKGGTAVKMSKRAGTYVSAKEVLGSVGKDSMIFFLLAHSPDTHIDFDLELAKERSVKNPVYYVQYAHARTISIFRKCKMQNAKCKITSQNSKLDLLNKQEELTLVKKLIQFPEVVEDTARDYQVHRLTRYAHELAREFHNFYEKHRVVTGDKDLTQARLQLVKATQIVLQSVLGLLGISAPRRM